MKVVKQICWLGLILAWNLDSGAASIYQDRADGALQSFLVKFWNGSYLRNRFPDDGSLTGYWTYAHGWDAVMDGVERTSKKEYFGLIESFYLGQNERGWIVGYYDDECWMTMAHFTSWSIPRTGATKATCRPKKAIHNLSGRKPHRSPPQPSPPWPSAHPHPQ